MDILLFTRPSFFNRGICNRLFFLFVVLFLLLFDLYPCHAAGPETTGWLVLKTKYLDLHYLTIEDLNDFDRKIYYSADSDTFGGFFSSGTKGVKLEVSLPKKLDALFEKVQLILDMRKAIKIRINIYPDESSLHNAYYKIYKKRRKLRGWYIFEYNTIYLNKNDLNEHMLAHEMAHAAIDNFMGVRPPRATAEILARYVDKHLYEEAKQY